MDNLRRFPAPWTYEEGKDAYRVKDANGILIAVVLHRQDLHSIGYQYADSCLTGEEARKIAKAISRLPDLLRRPQY